MRPSLKPLGEMIAVAALAALAALAAPVQAQDIGQAPLGAPRVPQSHSVEQANATLEQVARDRAAVNDEFAASERVCNTKFFVNNCLDKAKEKRRAALASLRAIEVEAQHFKRADSVAKRDADLAERVRKDNEEQALRAAKPPKAPKEEHEAPHAPTGPTVAEREAEHDAKEKRQAAQEAAGAGKRAANVAAFEEKQAESLRRQAIVAKKKEESAAKQAAKQASDKKKADAAAAAAASRQK